MYPQQAQQPNLAEPSRIEQKETKEGGRDDRMEEGRKMQVQVLPSEAHVLGTRQPKAQLLATGYRGWSQQEMDWTGSAGLPGWEL